MISLDLQGAYLQGPVHCDLRRYLRFVVQGQTYQFRVLYFGLTTASQVFTRIMAPVSPILHEYGVRMHCSLDDWLILVSSELACLQSRGQAPDSMYRTWHPGQRHEIVSSSHSITSVSRHGDSVSAFLSSTLSSSGRQSASSGRGVRVFLSPPAFLWRRLLGRLSSLTLLVPGEMLRMRLLQICLKDQGDFLDVQFQISWSPPYRDDLL